MASLKEIAAFSLEDDQDTLKSHQMDVVGSMSAIENRYARTSLDYEVLILDLKSKHRKEMREKEEKYQTDINEVKDELQRSDLKVNEINGRLEESRKSREELIDNIKKARKIYEQRILELEKCLEEANLKNQSFEDQKSKKDSSLYEKIDKLKDEIETIRFQNDEVNALLQTERTGNEKKEDTILELGKVIERTDNYLQEMIKRNEELFENSQKVFNAAESKGKEKGAVEVLECQLELSQSALEICRNDLSQERHKISRLEEEMAKINKDFVSAKVDVRFLTRENKQLTDKMANCNTDRNESLSKINDLETAKVENEKLILNLQNQVHLLQESLKAAIMDKNLSQKVLEDNEIEIKSLKKELSFAKLEIRNMELQKEEIHNLKQQIEEMYIITSENDSLLEDKVRNIDTLNKSISMLREACVVLEKQLSKFESLLVEKGHELEKSVRIISSLETENATLRNDIKKVRTDLNEAKSLKIYSEKKLMSVELCLQSEEKEKANEINLLLTTINDLQNMNEDLLRQVSKLNIDLQHNELTKTRMSQTVENLKVENSNFKQEVPKLISELVTLKDSNINFKASLEEAIRKAEKHKSKYEAMSKEKSLLVTANMENAFKVETTLKQHMKLIEHLKSQNELLSSKQKKRLFGTDKDNSSPTTPLKESNVNE